VAAVIVTDGPQKEDENLGRKEKAAVLHEVSPWLLVTEHLFVSFPLLDLNSLNVVFLLFTMQNDASCIIFGMHTSKLVVSMIYVTVWRLL